MNRVLIILAFYVSYSIAHPVSYTIDLDVFYDKNTQKVKVICKSNSKNKCGLYSYHLVNENDENIVTKRYPFLKKSSLVKVDEKPTKMIFFLRKMPEHSYIKIFE